MVHDDVAGRQNSARYEASYQHLAGTVGTLVSLIDGVEVHQLRHVVRVTSPSDDGRPDFLANDNINLEDAPDTLYASDGAIINLPQVTDEVCSRTRVIRSPSRPAPHPDMSTSHVPFNGFELPLAVTRSDGRRIANENVWITEERLPDHNVLSGEPILDQAAAHLRYLDSTGTYALDVNATTPPLHDVDVVDVLDDDRDPPAGRQCHLRHVSPSAGAAPERRLGLDVLPAFEPVTPGQASGARLRRRLHEHLQTVASAGLYLGSEPDLLQQVLRRPDARLLFSRGQRGRAPRRLFMTVLSRRRPRLGRAPSSKSSPSTSPRLAAPGGPAARAVPAAPVAPAARAAPAAPAALRRAAGTPGDPTGGVACPDGSHSGRSANLIVNGNAEAAAGSTGPAQGPVAVPGWTCSATRRSCATARTASRPSPIRARPAGATISSWAASRSSTVLQQMVNVGQYAQAIDQGDVLFDLSAFLGSYKGSARPGQRDRQLPQRRWSARGHQPDRRTGERADTPHAARSRAQHGPGARR